MSSFHDIAGKKIAGVPVLYLAGAAVAVLAVVAWRMKPSGDASAEESPSDGGADAQLDENGHADGSNPYAGYSGSGTVIVAPTPTPATDPEDNRPGSNDEWVREGAEWLVAEKKVSGQAAYVALNKYINGQSKSYAESGWVELVIAHQGLPPETFTGTPPTTSNPTPGPPAALKAVTGLRVVKKGKQFVSLTWNAAAGAKGYSVYRNGKVTGPSVVFTNGYVDGLKANTSYTFSVAAIYAGNKWGPKTNITVRTSK